MLGVIQRQGQVLVERDRALAPDECRQPSGEWCRVWRRY